MSSSSSSSSINYQYPQIQQLFPPTRISKLYFSKYPFPRTPTCFFSCKHQSSATSSPTTIGTSGSSSAPFANNNHMIQNLCKQGNLKKALQSLSIEPNPTIRTYECLILACADHNNAAYGRIVHRYIVEDGLDGDPFLSTRLVTMYGRFNALDDARQVFERARDKTVFLWNALLQALAMAGEGEEAVDVYTRMGRSPGIEFDSFTYSFVLKACVGSDSAFSHPYVAFERVRRVHGHLLRRGYGNRVYVTTTLVDVYSKLSRATYARRVFDGMLDKNVVSWSAMIACYARNEMPFDALELFYQMMDAANGRNNLVPNSVTIISVLQACAGLSAMELGKVVHAYVLRRGLDSIVSVINALIAMYSKCGNLKMARLMFDQMGRRRDVVSWNSMVSGLGMHGHVEEAIGFFEEMIRSGISPSPISFVSVLGACSHGGLVEKGKELFDSMTRQAGITPRAEHYASMVDLLGRAGQLDEAAKVIAGMRIEPGPTVWGSLLGACRIHGNVHLAERACSRLFKLEPTNAGNYMLLASIYADAQMWDKVSEVKKLIEKEGMQKLPGCSWIEVRRQVYSFVSVDETNLQIEQLDALLLRLVNEMKATTGYIPQTKIVLYDVEEEMKERILLGHSEKLAVAFGLINSRNGEVIRITKNLRLCEDCHSVTKFISKYTKREILVRDVNRFHHFRDGFCSCGDYW